MRVEIPPGDSKFLSLVTSAATKEEIIPRKRAAKSESSLFMRFSFTAGFPPQPEGILPQISPAASEIAKTSLVRHTVRLDE